jgi:Pvc16 N-terminal domain
MAGHQALAAVGRSIVNLLNRRFAEELPPGGPIPRAVMAGSVDFDEVNSSSDAVIRYPAVSVYCYRLSVDRETRPGWSAVASFDGIPRVPLRMHLLISAWDKRAEAELEWLGLTAAVLEADSILTGPLLHPSGTWDPGEAIQVVHDDLALDSMSEAFQALTTDYRLCLTYVARVVRINGRRETGAEPVTTVSLTEQEAPA